MSWSPFYKDWRKRRHIARRVKLLYPGYRECRGLYGHSTQMLDILLSLEGTDVTHALVSKYAEEQAG